MSRRPTNRPPAARSLLLLLLACAAFAGATAVAAHAAARPSLPTIERQVMCVTCKIPLNVAQSVQADRERAFIQRLIDEGRSEPAIRRALVAQYGPAVLGLPSASGFDLSAYLVPLAVVLALLGVLLALLPRWRRRARAQAALAAPAPLPAKDSARLDADLARFD
ncbi:MAG TPA: cytochrome c-type biogenesis protein CcmH [Solirubrobacteraceae bacterium]